MGPVTDVNARRGLGSDRLDHRTLLKVIGSTSQVTLSHARQSHSPAIVCMHIDDPATLAVVWLTLAWGPEGAHSNARKKACTTNSKIL